MINYIIMNETMYTPYSSINQGDWPKKLNKFPWFRPDQVKWIEDKTANLSGQEKEETQQELYRQLLPRVIAKKWKEERIAAKNEFYQRNLQKPIGERSLGEIQLRQEDLADKIKEHYGLRHDLSTDDTMKGFHSLMEEDGIEEQVLLDYLNGKNEEILYRTGMKKKGIWDKFSESMIWWVTNMVEGAKWLAGKAIGLISGFDMNAFDKYIEAKYGKGLLSIDDEVLEREGEYVKNNPKILEQFHTTLSQDSLNYVEGFGDAAFTTFAPKLKVGMSALGSVPVGEDIVGGLGNAFQWAWSYINKLPVLSHFRDSLPEEDKKRFDGLTAGIAQQWLLGTKGKATVLKSKNFSEFKSNFKTFIHENLNPAEIIANAQESILNIPRDAFNAVGKPTKNWITRMLPEKVIENQMKLTPRERAKVEATGITPAQFVLKENIGGLANEDKIWALQNIANEAYQSVSESFAKIPETELIKDSSFKEMLGVMIDEMKSSPIVIRKYKSFIEKLETLEKAEWYTPQEWLAIRRDFDAIVGKKIFDTQGRVSGLEDEIIAGYRADANNVLEELGAKYWLEMKAENSRIRNAITIRDWLLRSISQGKKNNYFGLQDLGIGGIGAMAAGDPITALWVIGMKKAAEKFAPGISQKLFNLNKSPIENQNIKKWASFINKWWKNGTRFNLSDRALSDSVLPQWQERPVENLKWNIERSDGKGLGKLREWAETTFQKIEGNEKYWIADATEKTLSAQQAKQIKNIRNGRSVEEIANDYGIAIEVADKITTPEGIRAYGKYGDGVITLAEKIKEGTAPHELFHATFDMVDHTRKESILRQIEKSKGLDSINAEEYLADSFSEYFRTGKFDTKSFGKGLVEKIKQYFYQVKQFITGANKNKAQVKKLFDEILDGEIDREMLGEVLGNKKGTDTHRHQQSWPRLVSVPVKSSIPITPENASIFTSKLNNLSKVVKSWNFDAVDFLDGLKNNLNIDKKSWYLISQKGWLTATLRISDHYANARNNKIRWYVENNTSIVIKLWNGKFKAKNGVDLIEFVYDPKNLTPEKMQGIIKGVQDWIDTGNYTDKWYDHTHKSIRASLENGEVKYQRVYHGSPYEFEKFDSAHMGKGAGYQNHWWGHYVAVDKEVGKAYSKGWNLYEVEVPDPVKAKTPTGSNYLELGDWIDKEVVIDFLSKLEKRKWANRKLIKEWLTNLKHSEFKQFNVTETYRAISKILWSDKEASLFLKELWYDGGHLFWGDDWEVYVIFDDAKLEIKKHSKL